MYNLELALFEVRARAQETARRATLHSTLGPAPKPPRTRLFMRRIVRLPEAIEIRHPVRRANGQAAINRRLRELARH